MRTSGLVWIHVYKFCMKYCLHDDDDKPTVQNSEVISYKVDVGMCNNGNYAQKDNKLHSSCQHHRLKGSYETQLS
jgi:hypothetical protein